MVYDLMQPKIRLEKKKNYKNFDSDSIYFQIALLQLDTGEV